jgi:AraC family transcriptional regulator
MQQNTFENYDDWYQRGQLAPFVSERRTPGAQGMYMLEAMQPAGDMSDPPTEELILVTDLRGSKGVIDWGAGRFSVRQQPNSLYVSVPGEATRIHIDCPHAVRFVCIPRPLVDTTLAQARLQTIDFGRLHVSGFGDSLLAQLMDSLWQAGDTANAAGRLFADTAATTIVARLLHLSGMPPLPNKGGLASRHLARIVEYIEARLADDISLDEIAAIAGMSPYHVCRAFKQSTGLPPHRYLMRLRLQRAKAMLETTNLPVTEIAAQVGYDDPGYLARLFRAHFGTTPANYRRERRS